MRLWVGTGAVVALMATLACGASNTSTGPTVPIASPSVAPTPQPSVSPPAPATSPIPTPTPSPLPPTPVADPTPEPCPDDSCEEPVTNTDPPVRVTIRLYSVVNTVGVFQGDWPVSRPIPRGYTATVDVTPKDEFGHDTLGSSNVTFEFSDLSMVKVTGNHPFQRRLLVLKSGTLEVSATLDEIQSNTLVLTFE